MKQMLPRFFPAVKGVAAGSLVIALTACANYSDAPLHTFSFDATKDSPDIRILDYRYGDTTASPARASAADVANDNVRQATHLGGYFRRGDSLYVKWRVKSTAQIYETTVNLKDRLPRDMAGQTISFTISGSQLLVYLISPQARPSSQTPQGPRIYQDYKSQIIYP